MIFINTIGIHVAVISNIIEKSGQGQTRSRAWISINISSIYFEIIDKCKILVMFCSGGVL